MSDPVGGRGGARAPPSHHFGGTHPGARPPIPSFRWDEPRGAPPHPIIRARAARPVPECVHKTRSSRLVRTIRMFESIGIVHNTQRI